MPDCTEAERAYLEACLQAGANPGRGLLDAIATERLTPELREEAIRARMAFQRAAITDTKAWQRIDAAGLHGPAREKLYQEINAEAEKRLVEPVESTGRLRQ
jgi:hypothetical protein